MKILALDSSTLTGSAAVVADGAVLAESTAHVRATHSERLLPLVDEVLSRSGLALGALDRIAVGTGPGSFTGVRLGVATAKGLHLASGVALVGVSSLDAIAASAWGARGYVLAALDARRDELYAALYETDGGGRKTLLGPLHAPPEAVGERVLAACASGSVLVVGDVAGALYGRLTAGAPARFTAAPPVVATPLARFVAWEAERGNGRLDAGELEPEYVRGSDAKLPGGREAAR